VYVDFPPSLSPTRETVVRSSFRTMENSRSSFPPMKEDTVVPKVVRDLDKRPKGWRDHPVLDLRKKGGGESGPLRELLHGHAQGLPEGAHVLPHRDPLDLPPASPVHRTPWPFRRGRRPSSRHA